MPLWVIALGLSAVVLYLHSKAATQSGPQQASYFYTGQTVSIPAGPMYSDAALTQDAGQWPGGTALVKVVDVGHNSVGFVGPSGAGLGGGAPAYVSGTVPLA